MSDDISTALPVMAGELAHLRTELENQGSALDKIEITMAATGRQAERIAEHLGLSTDEEGDPVEVLPFAPPALDRYMLWWLSCIRHLAANPLLSDAQAGGRIRALLYPQHIHADDGTVEGCPGCFPPGDAIPEAPRPESLADYYQPPASPRCGPGCGHEPEGREIALAPGSIDGDRDWMTQRRMGHTHPGDGIVEGCPGCRPAGQARPGTGVFITLQAGDLLTISWAGEPRTVICGYTGPGGTLLRDLTSDEQAGLDRQQDAEDEMRRREAP